MSVYKQDMILQLEPVQEQGQERTLVPALDLALLLPAPVLVQAQAQVEVQTPISIPAVVVAAARPPAQLLCSYLPYHVVE